MSNINFLPITESELEIRSDFTFAKAHYYADLINGGILPFKVSYKHLIVKQ